MKNGKALMGELGELRRGEVYFRTHNLLTSGDGSPSLKWGSTGVYEEDSLGRPRYRWGILDSIFDTYLGRGVRPYVEIGFMPEALSEHPEPYRHHWTPTAKYEEIYTGWAYPPKDYAKWEELVFQWAKHCVERYGSKEVARWYWETWNEPNIGYWRGTPEEFFELHDHAVAGVRRALPGARVGGADSAGSGGKFTRAFIEHCLRGTNFATGKVGTPLDFVSFHAKGVPVFVDGHVRMGLSNHLRTIADGFGIIRSYPELRGIPVVIGESDPDGCAACQGPQLGYRNTTLYSSYTAASFARIHELADEYGVNLEGALTWAFEFENQALFAGFRALASEGLDLPVLNVFRMFAKMGGTRLAVESGAAQPLAAVLKNGVRAEPEISAMASLDGSRLSVLVWHYHDDDIAGPAAGVSLTLAGLPPKSGLLKARIFRVDHDHANSFTAWQQMGAPLAPTPRQYALLRDAGRLTSEDLAEPLRVENSTVRIHLTLPRQAVWLIVFDPPSTSTL